MAQWGKTDAAASSPLWTPQQFKKKANTANRDAMYANNTALEGVFGVDATEVAVNGGRVAHQGWVLRRKGTGSIATITITAGGTGYNNTDIIRVASPAGGVNATASMTTNATGGIASLTITNRGSGFLTVNPSVSVTNATGGATGGSTATFVATAGGRAGRIQTEVLVAGKITTDGADDAVFPDA